MNIALDMMGGDYAPLEAVKGISLFLAEGDKNTKLTLIGDEAIVTAASLQLIRATERVDGGSGAALKCTYLARSTAVHASLCGAMRSKCPAPGMIESSFCKCSHSETGSGNCDQAPSSASMMRTR